MVGNIYPVCLRFFSKHVFITICAALVVSLSFTLLLLDSWNMAAAVGAALFFSGVAVIFLMGDVIRRFVYCFFLIQIIASQFILFSWYAAIISLMIFPVVIAFYAKNNTKELLIGFPYRKSLFLFLSGWAVTFVYVTVKSYGTLNFFSLHFDSYFLLGFFVAYGFYFLLKLEVLNPDKLVFYIALSGLTVIGFILAQYVLKGETGSVFGERFGVSASMNPNTISSYLDLTLPCAFFPAFFEKRNVIKKVLLYALSLVYVCIIFMAATRASLLGIAVIVTYIIWRKRSKKLLLGISACAAAFMFTFGGTVLKRMFNPVMGDIYSDLGRVELLRAAFRILSENYYFFGIGMNNFCRIKSEYGFPIWFDPSRVMSAHNFYVEVWLGFGILGLLGWLIFNIKMVVDLIRKRMDSAAALSVAFAVISFSLHGLFDCSYGLFPLMIIYFTLAGVGVFAVKTDKDLKTYATNGGVKKYSKDEEFNQLSTVGKNR